jgi:hypothetical protein
MGVPILKASPTAWECPSCPARDVTREPEAHTRFHHCAAFAGALLPMVVAGAGSRVILREREDYIGAEQVQLIKVDGRARPVMSAVTEHADGRVDAAIFAPTAGGIGRT